MKRVTIKTGTWSKVFVLVGKLVRYAKGGFTQIEKMDLVIDLLELIGSISDDIGEDVDGERKASDK